MSHNVSNVIVEFDFFVYQEHQEELEVTVELKILELLQRRDFLEKILMMLLLVIIVSPLEHRLLIR